MTKNLENKVKQRNGDVPAAQKVRLHSFCFEQLDSTLWCVLISQARVGRIEAHPIGDNEAVPASETMKQKQATTNQTNKTKQTSPNHTSMSQWNKKGKRHFQTSAQCVSAIGGWHRYYTIGPWWFAHLIAQSAIKERSKGVTFCTSMTLFPWPGQQTMVSITTAHTTFYRNCFSCHQSLYCTSTFFCWMLLG